MDSRLILPVNTILDGSYRILRKVGSGGFGITYEAEDIHLGTAVAVKEYYPFDFGDRDRTMSVRPKSERHKATFEWGRASFLEEARTLARFEHPSIVRVTRVFEANATAYMVMRFEQGLSLEDWLCGLERPPTQSELDRIAGSLLGALETMHAANFLHRDIAPDNIIVRPDGTPVLLDFGAARRAVAEVSRSLTGIVKAGYSPHEQYATDGRLQGAWSDLYALGGTLYRAVCGKPPEEATLRFDEDQMASAERAAKGKYRREFLAAIDACLEVRPSLRPRSVAQLRPMLLGETSDPKRSERPVETRGTRQLPRSARIAPPGRQRASARQWLMAAAAMLAILGGAFGGFAYTHWDPGAAQRRAALQAAKIKAGLAVVRVRARQRAEKAEQERRRIVALEGKRRQAEAEEKFRHEAELEKKRIAAREEAQRHAQADAAEKRHIAALEDARLKAEAEKAAAARKQRIAAIDEANRQAAAKEQARRKAEDDKRQAAQETERRKPQALQERGTAPQPKQGGRVPAKVWRAPPEQSSPPPIATGVRF